MPRAILVSDGHEIAVVDDEDFLRIAAHKWRVMPNGYAARCERDPRTKRDRLILMHREVLGVGQGIQVDHANRDKMDNRRTNLRIATQSQNNANQVSVRGLSVFKGVYPADMKWIAKIGVDGGSRYLGSFDDEITAAMAYDRAALAHYGEFARLNFPSNSAVREPVAAAG